MHPSLTELRRILAEEIPLSRHLGVTALMGVDGRLELQAPLPPNRNQEGTAFGGSLNAVATLAGWCAVWLALREAGVEGRIVLQDSAVRYLRPVVMDFRAGVALNSERRATMLDTLERKNRARITVDVEIEDDNGKAVLYAGRYVVQR